MKSQRIKWLRLLLVICILTMLVLLFWDLDRGHNNTKKELLTKLVPSNVKYIHVCGSTDENNLLGLVTMINSVAQNTKTPVSFHIMCSTVDVKEHLEEWLKKLSLNVSLLEAKVFDASPIQEYMNVEMGKRKLAYNAMNIARFYYAEYFPDLHGHVIHLDSDIIVQGDITELNKVSTYHGQVLAVSDDCTHLSKRYTGFPPLYNSFINCNHEHILAEGMHPLTCSFNTGVYLADLNEWRRQNITRKMVELLKLNSKSDLFGSKVGGGTTGPMMMILFYKKYKPIEDPLWNLRYLGFGRSRHLSTAFVNQSKLLHWSGPNKPWTIAAQYSNLWDRYYVKDPRGKLKPVRKKTV